MGAVTAVFQVLEFVGSLLSPLVHWREWDETANPIALILAIFGAIAVVVFFILVAASLLDRP